MLVKSKERASVRIGAPLRDRGMWMGQDVWCSTSIPSAQIAAHLSSLPADLNGALLLKHREAISSETAHLQGRVPGGGEPPWVICRLRVLFLKKSRLAHAGGSN